MLIPKLLIFQLYEISFKGIYTEIIFPNKKYEVDIKKKEKKLGDVRQRS